MVKGDSETGKSTVLNIIKAMFSPGSVGILNSNFESTFGLEAQHNKELLITHEVPEHMSSKLSSDLFKQMVCGEDVSVACKNKSALTIKWDVPMFLCGNSNIAYDGIQGSVSRWLAIFMFDRHVPNKDLGL